MWTYILETSLWGRITLMLPASTNLLDRHSLQTNWLVKTLTTQILLDVTSLWPLFILLSVKKSSLLHSLSLALPSLSSSPPPSTLFHSLSLSLPISHRPALSLSFLLSLSGGSATGRASSRKRHGGHQERVWSRSRKRRPESLPVQHGRATRCRGCRRQHCPGQPPWPPFPLYTLDPRFERPP